MSSRFAVAYKHQYVTNMQHAMHVHLELSPHPREAPVPTTQSPCWRIWSCSSPSAKCRGSACKPLGGDPEGLNYMTLKTQKMGSCWHPNTPGGIA